MHQNQYFETTSLALAASLVATLGARLSHFAWHEGKATFAFESSPQLLDMVQAFWRREAPCDSLTYFEALKYIKNRLWEEKP
jgi:hypothetical protein